MEPAVKILKGTPGLTEGSGRAQCLLWLCLISVQDGDSPVFYYRYIMNAYEPALRPLFLSVLTNGRNR